MCQSFKIAKISSPNY